MYTGRIVCHNRYNFSKVAFTGITVFIAKMPPEQKLFGQKLSHLGINFIVPETVTSRSKESFHDKNFVGVAPPLLTHQDIQKNILAKANPMETLAYQECLMWSFL